MHIFEDKLSILNARKHKQSIQQSKEQELSFPWAV